MSLNRNRQNVHRRQTGAVAVAFILLFVALLGFAGLAIDAGRLYISKTELQNAADACALAAASALTGANANQLQVAEDYGIAAGTRNKVGMQNIAATITPNADITFSQTLDGAYQPRSTAVANWADMRYARCTLAESNIPTILIQVVNLLPGNAISNVSTVRATAVASLEPSISHCALPVAICKSDLTDGVTGAWKPAGTWFQGVLEGGSHQQISGSFRWIEYPGYTINKELESLMTGSGQCDLTDINSVQSHQGANTSMYTAYDSRFGLYMPGAGNPKPADAPPDLTGWVYNEKLFPEKANAMADFMNKRAQLTPKHQSNSVFKPKPPFSWATDEEFQAGQDRRLIVGPIVDCSDLGSNGTAAVEDWACYLMLNPAFASGDTIWLEYRGLASSPGSGCVTSGAPGGAGAGGPKVPTLVQ